MPPETKMQDLLTALTDAVIAEESNIESFADFYDVPRKEANALLHVIRRVNETMTPVEPSAAFSRRLKLDLVGAPRQNLIWRWRSLPARVQIAWSFAVFGGFGLFIIQRLASWVSRRQHNEEAAASVQS